VAATLSPVGHLAVERIRQAIQQLYLEAAGVDPSPHVGLAYLPIHNRLMGPGSPSICSRMQQLGKGPNLLHMDARTPHANQCVEANGHNFHNQVTL